MIVFPGGGYEFLSDREGEPVALQFMAAGYSSFVMDYSIKTAYPVPLIEACMAIACSTATTILPSSWSADFSPMRLTRRSS